MTDYFVQIEGITGDSVQRGFEGWFTAAAYRWSFNGGDALPLIVDTHALKGVALVEAKAVAGSPLGRVEFQAYEIRPGGWSLRIVLTNPLVVASTIGWSQGGELVTRWSLGRYTRADVSSRSVDERGNWLPAKSATWPA